ncbi:hypothetical protein [Pararhizobium haloflavum]|uniref:hypothetical protein n=1 Tax=Pararhizobium haloflavum TaxID=2037914 RepID=UPI000C184AA7|nr:hypothetical protein [Pararhizobium haloflavum]
MRILLVASFLLLMPAIPSWAQDGSPAASVVTEAAPVGTDGESDQREDPPMGRGGECRHEGNRIPQGERICITANGETFSALCGMSLNNTSWIRQDAGTACP